MILGGTGMLGHKVWEAFEKRFDTWVTIRGPVEPWLHLPFFRKEKVIENVNAFSQENISKALDKINPEVVVNCIGIVKKLKESENPLSSITLNALLPHWLAEQCRQHSIRFIHISTDCVFSGKTGNYTEEDLPDPYDLYGRTKLLGEVAGNGCLTLRTSIIGRELKRTVGLLEWFLSQRGKTIQGYKHAIFTGVITSELAAILADIIANNPGLYGLYHLSSDPINKYDLLNMIKSAFDLEITINEDEGVSIDRSLDSSKLRKIINYEPPTWEEMIQRLSKEAGQYEEWRR